ncbi:MAG: zinc ribbon domain-containing protein [bacterium]
MTEIIFILLAAATSFLIAYPIVQSKEKKELWRQAHSNHRANDLEENKNNIYAAIKDIEFDYRMGKLSEEDFRQLRQQYKDEAIGLLKKIDQFQRRKQKKGRRATSKTMHYCWICGTAISSEDKYCANCGNKVSSS